MKKDRTTEREKESRKDRLRQQKRSSGTTEAIFCDNRSSLLGQQTQSSTRWASTTRDWTCLVFITYRFRPIHPTMLALVHDLVLVGGMEATPPIAVLCTHFLLAFLLVAWKKLALWTDAFHHHTVAEQAQGHPNSCTKFIAKGQQPNLCLLARST